MKSKPKGKIRPVKKEKNSGYKKISGRIAPIYSHGNIEKILWNLSSPVNVFDHVKEIFIYVNEAFTRLIGIPPEDCYDQHLKDFTSWINNSDLHLLQNQVGKRLYEIYSQHINDPSDQLTYLVNFNIKNRSAHDKQTMILAQCTVVEWKDDFTPAITYNVLTGVSEYLPNNKMILTVNKLDKNTQEWKTLIKEEFLKTPPMLTTREKQITEHILKDKSATKISKELNIPFHTVRAHWRNILQKTQCKTQKELKHLAHREGWV